MSKFSPRTGPTATGLPAPFDDPERTICFCHNVPLRDLLVAIREKGARTVVDLQAETCASTGCGGCEFDLLDLLEALSPKE